MIIAVSYAVHYISNFKKQTLNSFAPKSEENNKILVKNASFSHFLTSLTLTFTIRRLF